MKSGVVFHRVTVEALSEDGTVWESRMNMCGSQFGINPCQAIASILDDSSTQAGHYLEWLVKELDYRELGLGADSHEKDAAREVIKILSTAYGL